MSSGDHKQDLGELLIDQRMLKKEIEDLSHQLREVAVAIGNFLSNLGSYREGQSYPLFDYETLKDTKVSDLVEEVVQKRFLLNRVEEGIRRIDQLTKSSP